MADDLSIIIQSKLASAQESKLDEQIKQLSSQIKEQIELKLKIDVSDLQLVTKQVEEVRKKIKAKTFTKDSLFINSKVENQAFNDITARLREVKKNVDEFAKVRTQYSVDDKGKNKLETATLTYYNKELKQTVTETMKWVETTKEVNGELQKMRTFRSVGIDISDNMSQAAKEAQKLLDEQEKQEQDRYVRSWTAKINEIEERNKLDLKVDQETEKQEQERYVRSWIAKIREVEERNKDMQKSMSDLKAFQDKMMGVGGISGELDIFSKKNKGRYDLDVFAQLKKDIQELTVNTPNFQEKIQQLGLKFSFLKQNAAESGNVLVRAMENMGKFLRFYLLGGILVSGVNAIRNSVQYMTELDNNLNQIRIVTQKTQAEVEKLATSYNMLAREMNVSTQEIASTAADLYRQGLNDSQVEERMKSIIKYAKISSISLADSNKIITATANATGESVEKIINIFALLGDTTASGADEIGEALQRVASTSEGMGVSLEKASAWISTISSITREGASTIGRSLNSLMSRYSQIREKGFNEEDATKLNDVVTALTSIGIQAVDSQGQLMDFTTVMDSLGAVYGDLDINTQNYIATTMAGTYQMNRFKTLMMNYGQSITSYEEALNSAGVANQKFAIYQESSQAAMDRFGSVLDGMVQKLISSDFLKSIINFGTEFLQIIERLIDGLGGLGTALLILIPIITTKFLTSLITIKTVEGVLTVSTIGLTTAFKGLGTALITLAANPITWIITALGLVVAGITAYANNSQKLKQQTEELTKSQQVFNSALADFNQTLDVAKINATAEALERLKQALNYEQSLKEVEKLKGWIDWINNAKIFGIPMKQQLENLGLLDLINDLLPQYENNIDKVNDAQKQYNEAQEIANAIDAEALKTNISKIATKVREIEVDKQLLKQYNDSVKAGREDLNLKQKIIDKYPQYISGINKSTGQIEINTQALEESLTAQKNVQLAQIVTTQVAISESNRKVQALIDDTQLELEAANSIIEKNKALVESYQAVWDSAEPQDSGARRHASRQSNTARTQINNAQEQIVLAKARLDQLKEIDTIQKNYIKMSPEEILSAYSASATSSGGGYKAGAGASETAKEIYKPIADIYYEIDNALEQVNQRLAENQALIDIADEEEKNQLLKERAELYKQQAQALEVKNDAQKEEMSLLKSALSSKGFTFDKAGNLTNYTSQLSKFSGDQAKDIETAISRYTDLFTSIIPNTSTQILQIKKSLSDLFPEVEENKVDSYHDLNRALADVNNRLEENQALSNTASESRLNSLLKDRIGIYKEKRQVLEDINKQNEKELELLRDSLEEMGFVFDGNKITNYADNIKNAGNEAQNLVDKFTELSDSTLPSVNLEIIELGNSIEDTVRQLTDGVIDKFDSMYDDLIDNISSSYDAMEESVTSSTEAEIEALESAKEATRESFDLKIKGLEDQIALLEKVNKEQSEEEERQKRLMDIEKQRQRLINVQQEKNVRLYKDGKFIWIANPKTVEEETEKLTEMQEGYYDWEEDLRQEKTIQQLRDQIDAIREEQRLADQNYDRQIDNLRDFLDNKQDELDRAEKEQIAGANKLKDALEAIDENMYSSRLEYLQAFISTYNSMVKDLNLDLPQMEMPDIPDTDDNDSGSSSGGNNSGSTGSYVIGMGSKVPTPNAYFENDAFIKAVYRGLLGREPDGEGFSYWLSQLNQGLKTQDQMERHIMSTPEYKKRIASFDGGGYTGTWAGDDGKFALLHKEESVFGKDDTKNLLSAVKLINNFIPLIQKPNFPKLATNVNNNNGKTNNYYVNIDKVVTEDLPSFVDLLPTLVHQYK